MRGCLNPESEPPRGGTGGPILILPVGHRGMDGLEWRLKPVLRSYWEPSWAPATHPYAPAPHPSEIPSLGRSRLLGPAAGAVFRPLGISKPRMDRAPPARLRGLVPARRGAAKTRFPTGRTRGNRLLHCSILLARVTRPVVSFPGADRTPASPRSVPWALPRIVGCPLPQSHPASGPR
jgi:hypothetical protein